jgi:hypothetical protein
VPQELNLIEFKRGLFFAMFNPMNINLWEFFLISEFILLGVAVLSFRVGKNSKTEVKSIHSDTISNNVMGLLALILGFSFSMAINRFEYRRTLTVQEANAIGTAYSRSEILPFKNPQEMKNLFKEYVELRIKAYRSDNFKKVFKETQVVQNKIWKEFRELAKKDKGIFENSFLISLNEMFDSGNSRNVAFVKLLPVSFYVLVLLIASAAVGMMSFDLGQSRDTSHWRSGVLIFLFGILFSFIFDVDHSRKGFVRISQDAMLEVRSSM